MVIAQKSTDTISVIHSFPSLLIGKDLLLVRIPISSENGCTPCLQQRILRIVVRRGMGGETIGGKKEDATKVDH